MKQIIAVGADHAGYELKQALINSMTATGLTVTDMGTYTAISSDYPDFGYKVAQAIQAGQAHYGIVICGSGIGISIAANRYPLVRAALCLTPQMALLARQHNDANVLALGARLIDPATAMACVECFLKTAFEGGRHQTRVEKLSRPPCETKPKL